MTKTFKCEYCGRRIKTEECPYCGGVNELPLEFLSDGSNKTNTPSVKDASATRTATVSSSLKKQVGSKKKIPFLKKVKTFFSIHTCLRDLVIAAMVFVVLIIGLFFVYLATKEPDPVYTYSDTVLDWDGELTVSIPAMDRSFDIVLPSTLNEIGKNITFITPAITSLAEQDPDLDGVLDLKPFEGTSISDSYGLIYFDIINDSYDSLPYTDATCDKLRMYRFSENNEIKSLKIQGKELITGISSVIDSLGEPSSMCTYSDSKEIKYKTDRGEIRLSYHERNDYASPETIYIENLSQARKYYLIQ